MCARLLPEFRICGLPGRNADRRVTMERIHHRSASFVDYILDRRRCGEVRPHEKAPVKSYGLDVSGGRRRSVRSIRCAFRSCFYKRNLFDEEASLRAPSCVRLEHVYYTTVEAEALVSTTCLRQLNFLANGNSTVYTNDPSLLCLTTAALRRIRS